MIDLMQARGVAYDYAKGLFDTTDIQLEEVVISEDKKYIDLTLSFPDTSVKPNFAALMTMAARKYKVFKIDAGSGKVVSVTIRKV